jgi:hypothetical protein
MTEEPNARRMSSRFRADLAVLLAIAAMVALVHLLTNGRYGFHRDELQTLSDARHLDWGFVAYPPVTPFLERIGLSIFGVSLVGLRLFAVIAQSAAIVITGLMARELSGGRLAQVAAALGVAFSPLPLFEGTEFQYTSFDYLWWVLIAYFIIRLLKTDNPRWLLAIGAVIGVGLMTKYTMLFLVAGILVGLLLTPARRFLGSRWFWGGVALAFLIFLPNLIWQVRHDFISFHFLRHIHARDVGEGRGYYLAAAYPMLMAMGAVVCERWLASLPPLWRRAVATAYLMMLVAWGLYVCTVILPLASSGPLRDFALENNGELREEIGWNELVRTVAGIRDSLPPDQQQHVGVLVGNYGEQGAIEMLGPAYHLPAPISMTNSAWLRGYPEPPPSSLIVIGFSREDADKAFTSCRLAGHNGNPHVVQNEESKDHPDIFVCGGPRKTWPEFWDDEQRFG